jgi:signal transduction histidine kinase/ActR/RegA family two-component response regulator
MWERLKIFFDTTLFAPHGICLQWEPELLVVHIVSDVVIAASYFSIPFALAYFVSKRRDVEFGWVFWAFALFIMACGVTHVFSIYTLWVPVYGVEGLVKVVTAIASIVTAVLLWPLIPKLLTIPSPSQLRLAHAMLEAEAEQRREAQELFRHAQKMEAIGQLTGGVAHDFNNLLMVISGNLDVARRALAQGARERVNRALESAYEGAERATTLTARLLAFARKQPFDTKVINVNHVISGMADFFRRTLGETIDLEIVTGAGLWRTETDAHQLEAAMLNLVVNARDAMPNGGRLTIETGNAYVDDDYARSAGDLNPGQYIVIAVTDNGVGMDRETADRAFEPFFSTKETGHGTGLGLSQVYGFAKQSRGFAKIYSEPRNGTTVKLYLPRVEGVIPKTPPSQVLNDWEMRGEGETILVVEDDDAVRRHIVETLVELGYEVLEAKGADEAVRLFQEHEKKAALLLTDVVMPEMNGRALSEQLLLKQPALKVLFMTGYSRNAIVHQGRLDPGVELLQKPFTQKALAQKLRTMLGDAAGRLSSPA